MCFKRCKKPVDSAADLKRQQLTRKVLCAQSHLQECTENVIVRQQVIGLYPDGADKDKACEDFADAQRSMLCAIATLDDAISELHRYVKAHWDDFVTTKYKPDFSRDFNSHRCIEKTWRSFDRTRW